ncbi:hypothetical protein BLOT_006209 [Blomia tropicalis]|nr:hypothetical protein BLOT_006209 [Blomia tropicalis]
MENTSNRLSSAKWSRNLNEDSQTDANRLRLLERQRQMLETKLQRRQNPTATSAVVASRPATSIAGVRARVSRQSFSDGQSDGSINVNTSNAEFETIIRDVTEHCETIPTTTRARTSIAANRKLTNVDSPSKSTSGNDNRKSIGNNGSSNYNNNNNNNPATNSPLTNRQQTPIRTNLRDLRSLSRSEANITVTRGQDILSKVAKTGTELLTPNPLTTVLSDEELLNFVTQPISPKVTLQCTIIRDKKGLDRTMFPTYFMHLQGKLLHHIFIIVVAAAYTTSPNHIIVASEPIDRRQMIQTNQTSAKD